MDLIIGRRLKNFRKSKNITQQEIELRCGLSSGGLSRIENGLVNPTKETILKIANILNLNEKQISYLIGPLRLPATQKEINFAIDEVREYFSNRKVFAYLIDDRFRLLYLSKGFLRFLNLFGINLIEVEKSFIGHSLSKITFDKRVNAFKFLDKSKREEILTYQLARFVNEVGFMKDDKFYLEGVKYIRSNPIASRIFDDILNGKIKPNVNSINSKIIVYNWFGMKFRLKYFREKLATRFRFETLEYFPTNRLLKFILK